jgi:hypothetical protein
MWLRRRPFLEGPKGSHGQCGLKRRGLAKEEVDDVDDDTVFAIGKTKERKKRTNSRMCWGVGPQEPRR